MKMLDFKKPLFLEDFSGNSCDLVRAKLVADFQITRPEIDRFQILVAYMSEGPHGCDSSAWLLLKDRSTGGLFEVHASHCSCYGFEGQFSPEPTNLEYLKSDKFGLSVGGYDGSDSRTCLQEFIKSL